MHTVAFLVFYIFYLHLLCPVSLFEFFFWVSITSCHLTQFIDVASVFISSHYTYTYSKFACR